MHQDFHRSHKVAWDERRFEVVNVVRKLDRKVRVICGACVLVALKAWKDMHQKLLAEGFAVTVGFEESNAIESFLQEVNSSDLDLICTLVVGDGALHKPEIDVNQSRVDGR